MAKQIHTFVVARPVGNMKLTGFLDMLRYDQATVLEHDQRMIVLHADHEPTTGRWASFGLHVLTHSKGAFPNIQMLRMEAGERLP